MLSLVSVIAFGATLEYLRSRYHLNNLTPLRGLHVRIVIPALLILAVLPKVHRYAASVLWGLLALYTVFLGGLPSVFWLMLVAGYSVVLFACIACDLAALTMFRGVLRWLDTQETFWRSLGALAATVVIVIVLLAGPVKLAAMSFSQFDTHNWTEGTIWTLGFRQWLVLGGGVVAALAAVSNTLTVLFMLFMSIVIIVALGYQPFFSLLARPLYSLVRHGFFQRKILFSISLLFFAASSIPWVADYLKKLRP
jgi:hypothetical protein